MLHAQRPPLVRWVKTVAAGPVDGWTSVSTVADADVQPAASAGPVIVVGGGLAGIAAALAMADAGKGVVLVEATKRLGGRVHSVTDPVTGLTLDNCQHAAFRVYDRFLQLLGRVDARGAMRLQARTVLPFVEPATGKSGALRSGRLSPPNHLVGSMLRFPFLSGSEKVALRQPIKAMLAADADTIAAWDTMTFAAWLTERGQGERALARFWGPTVAAALNVEISVASAAQCIQLFVDGLLSGVDRFDVGAFTDHLGASVGEPAATALAAAGVEVRLGERVAAMQWSGDQCVGVRIGDDVLDGEVVLATAPWTSARLLRGEGGPPAAEQVADHLDALGVSSLIGVHALYAGARLPATFTFASCIDEPLIQMVFNRDAELATPLEHDGERLQWLSVPVSAADAWLDTSDQDIGAALERVLDGLHPAGGAVPRRRLLVIRTKRATWAPVAGTAAHRQRPDALPGGPVLAGDHVAHRWPSTMEAAVRGGLWAAATVLGDPAWTPDELWSAWPAPPLRGDPAWPVWA